MSPVQVPLHVALVGATGNLGPAILTQLLSAGFHVTIFARVGSGSKVSSTGTATIREVDYASHGALVQALSSPPVDVVVCTLGWFPGFFDTQKAIIDACIEAGCVKRFLPSEFGNGANANVRKFPLLWHDKSKTQDYLVETVEKAAAAAGTVQNNNPISPGKNSPSPDSEVVFSYTIVNTGSFLDWQLERGFMVNLKDRTATLYDGGDVRCSATRVVTIGKAVVGVLRNLDATRNRHVFVHDVAITQNQLIGLAKKIDGDGDGGKGEESTWTTTSMSTADVERDAYKALEEGDFMSATLRFISRACWGQGFGQDFSDKLDNEILGIPVMSEEDIEGMMRDIMAKL
ncbi:hypothetical protein LTR99_007153 [Exophiala xenobiotica]|uniref:NmrA-like domain-containing protein n=1 Tax=Vermiconidia calcicola TaxID=1690605 RepID=A0AAV9PTK9_9PEZI|nr:hypothetical protein LTR96_005416 [Exophiala xenobiotica]KAK5528946.1 hypothetical protein LTR25_010131 [Vermiconidia calcicola]KAK5544887.1 hypothetical protein LTR23_004016 [Chaetothyriales sp. CCFEE 6169]KAK5300404.1 hypothetical protein LTR99_007153 [Exophiala xenobiotica]KAK5334213.1 hypothetical protein LTR98_009676 [Exophiala xenobiotica]